MLLDSGRDCPRCEDRQAHRRAQRRELAAQVDAVMPGAGEAERRAATEQQLHQDVTDMAWVRAQEWEEHRARQAAAARSRAEAAAMQPEHAGSTPPTAPAVLPAPRTAPIPGIKPEHEPKPKMGPAAGYQRGEQLPGQPVTGAQPQRPDR